MDRPPIDLIFESFIDPPDPDLDGTNERSSSVKECCRNHKRFQLLLGLNVAERNYNCQQPPSPPPHGPTLKFKSKSCVFELSQA